MKTFDQLAKSAYETYVKKVGGLVYSENFRASPQPTYEELTADRKAAWVAVAQQVTAEIAAIH